MAVEDWRGGVFCLSLHRRCYAIVDEELNNNYFLVEDMLYKTHVITRARSARGNLLPFLFPTTKKIATVAFGSFAMTRRGVCFWE